MVAYEFANSFNDMVRGVSINTQDIEPGDIGTTLEQLEDADGSITAEKFIDKSRPKRSKTHKLFEWDNGIAADKYRLEQAKLAIRCVKAIVKIEGGGEETIRAYSSVRAEGGGRVYVRTTEHMKTRPGRDELLNECLGELCRWRKKWVAMNEVAEAIATTDPAVDIIQKVIAKTVG